MENYTIREASLQETDAIMELYRERMTWFAENQIVQWRHYLDNHPKSEFEKIISSGNYYVVVSQESEIIGGFEISDGRVWGNLSEGITYIEKIIVKIGYKNVGDQIFSKCREICTRNKKEELRLVCIKKNKKLNEIYLNRGFQLVDNFVKDNISFSLYKMELVPGVKRMSAESEVQSETPYGQRMSNYNIKTGQLKFRDLYKKVKKINPKMEGWQDKLLEIQEEWTLSNEFKHTEIEKFRHILKDFRPELLELNTEEFYEDNFIYCVKITGTKTAEYFSQQMYKYDKDTVKELVAPGLQLRFFYYFFNKWDATHLLAIKWVFNTIWSEYVTRPWCYVDKCMYDKNNFIDIFSNSSKLIIKKVDGSCGKGIEARNVDSKAALEEVYDRLVEFEEAYVVEECLNQKGILSSFNSDSVNTVRVITIRTCGIVNIIFAFLRVGRNGFVIDNLHANGLLFSIDINTGVVGNGIDKYGRDFITHPDSGVTIKGITIPRWQEVCDICIKAHNLAPDSLNFIGWDVYVSEGEEIQFLEANTMSSFISPYDESVSLFSDLSQMVKANLDYYGVNNNSNTFVLKSIRKDDNKVIYDFVVRGDWKKFFNSSSLMVEYPFEISEVPMAVLAASLLGIIAPLCWICNALVVMPECDSGIRDTLESIRRCYRDKFPDKDWNYKLYVTRYRSDFVVSTNNSNTTSISYTWRDLSRLSVGINGKKIFAIHSSLNELFSFHKNTIDEFNIEGNFLWFRDFQRDIVFSSLSIPFSYATNSDYKINIRKKIFGQYNIDRR